MFSSTFLRGSFFFEDTLFNRLELFTTLRLHTSSFWLMLCATVIPQTMRMAFFVLVFNAETRQTNSATRLFFQAKHHNTDERHLFFVGSTIPCRSFFFFYFVSFWLHLFFFFFSHFLFQSSVTAVVHTTAYDGTRCADEK